jgi:hypothetical protein
LGPGDGVAFPAGTGIAPLLSEQYRGHSPATDYRRAPSRGPGRLSPQSGAPRRAQQLERCAEALFEHDGRPKQRA